MQVKPIDAQRFLNKDINSSSKKLNLSFREAT
jgi:hypothetical protein